MKDLPLEEVSRRLRLKYTHHDPIIGPVRVMVGVTAWLGRDIWTLEDEGSWGEMEVVGCLVHVTKREKRSRNVCVRNIRNLFWEGRREEEREGRGERGGGEGRVWMKSVQFSYILVSADAAYERHFQALVEFLKEKSRDFQN